MLSSVEVDRAELAAELRLVVTRLSRQLRQQSTGDLSPTTISALFTIRRHGPLTLGELAAQEQVAPPTITRMVGRLESLGLVTRTTDRDDRRVCRVEITRQGAKELERVRRRRTAWLATRLRQLEPDELARLADTVSLLERLVEDPR